jgi:hypothetical protein
MRNTVKAAALAAGALVAASTAACGGTHTSSPTTVTVTATATTTIAPVTPVTPVMPPAGVRQWVNAGQLDFYVKFAFDSNDEVFFGMFVKNTSGVPQTYMAAAQQLMDDQGRVFAPKLGVGSKYPGTNLEPGSDPPSGAIDQFDLNPGMASGLVLLYFEVPPGTSLHQFSLVVHGSPTSVGSPIHLHGDSADDPGE